MIYKMFFFRGKWPLKHLKHQINDDQFSLSSVPKAPKYEKKKKIALHICCLHMTSNQQNFGFLITDTLHGGPMPSLSKFTPT